MMKPKIVVVGSANTDMVVKVQHLPGPGETVLGGDFTQSRGGKGANQAVAAVRLGAEVTFVARIGVDVLGKEAVAAYEAEGIHTQYLVRDQQAPSGVALITVNDHGENSISVAPGANAKLSPADIMAAEPAFKEANCLLVQLEIPLEAVRAAMQLAAKYHIPIILNPAPATQLPDDLLKMVDFLTPNETEAAILAGNHLSSRIKDITYLLRSKTNIKNIVVTLGKDGAMIMGYKNETIPPYRVAAVDTTGAGDAFNGGLAVALARGDALPNAVRFANAVAALSTTRAGAQTSMPTLDEVNDFLKLQPSQEMTP